MPVRGLDTEYVLADLHREGLEWLGDGVEWFDVHTHIGFNDPDGFRADGHELLAALDAAGQQGALVFAMHEPAGYREANDAVLAACARSGGRLRALARVDPNHEDALAEARRCLDLGALGVKLHPRSDAFAVTHPAVSDVVAEVAARRGMVLFHAGRGIPALGERALELAREHPDVRIVLAHAGISDLELCTPYARDLPNLMFDTAWWHPSDVLALFTHIPPGQILYATDMPYGPPSYAAAQLARCARAVGLSADVAREQCGAQALRAVGGEPLADLGPAAGDGALSRRNLACERVVAYMTSAVQMVFRGADPTEAVALAHLACRSDDPVLAYAARCLTVAEDELARRGPEGIVEACLAAQLVCATPALGAPPV